MVMPKERETTKEERYCYGKGILVATILQNSLLLFFLIIISTKEGYEFFGLFPIWAILTAMSIAAVIYYYKKINILNRCRKDKQEAQD